MSVNVGDVVIPGEAFTNAKELTADNKKIVLGDGLRFVVEIKFREKIRSSCLLLGAT